MAIADVSSEFTDEFQAWVRLEPRCRADDFSKGIEARTADPLWMLARQWQTGELTGEDAASPIQVKLEYLTQTPKHARLGESGPVEELKALPLETIVEQEQCELSWRERIQIGQQFEQIAYAQLGMNAAPLIHACRKQYPLTITTREQWVEIDRATRRAIHFAAGRVPDGKLLLDELEKNKVILPTGITAQQLAAVASKLFSWCKRMNLTRQAAQPLAWRNEQLDYRFELNPPPKPDSTVKAKSHLIAPDYRNGALDWYSFNVASSQGDWEPHDSITTVPAPISIGGTSPRWWAFEDGATHFGKIDIAKPDLAKLLLMEFVLIYGDDWFSLPLPVKMPNLVKIKELTLSNVFGETVPIPAARTPHTDPMLRFELFALSPVADARHPGVCDTCQPGTSEFLFIPPMAGYREESPALEEIRFLRDEGANKVWGVEHQIQNGLGRPMDGFDAQRERIERREEEEIVQLEIELADIEKKRQAGDLSPEQRDELTARTATIAQRLTRLREGPQPASGGIPRYRLATTVPENWIPFAPMNSQLYLGRPSIRLRRAQMLRNVDDEAPTPILAMSRLLELDDDPLLWLEEATVPRSGVRVQLTGQRVRWVDGKTYVWLGRKVTAGRGEGGSGLRFDILKT